MPTVIRFACCFCTQECDGKIRVVLVMDGDDDSQEQTWFAHFGCFERALHEKVRGTIETEFD